MRPDWRERGQRFDRRRNSAAGEPVVTVLALSFDREQRCIHQLAKMKARRLRRDVAEQRELARWTRAAVNERDEDRRANRFADEPRNPRDVWCEFHAPMVS